MYQRRKSKLTLGCIVVLGLLLILGICSAVSSIGKSANVTPTPEATTAAIDQVTPTDTPTPEPTPNPTTKPHPTAIPQLAITFTLVDAGDVAVHTLPGASLTIKVLYCSGNYATSQALQGTVQADIAGDYIWNWNVETSCHGRATAYVTASLNGKTASGQAHFTT